MVNEELEAIIRQKYQQGLSRAEIRDQLLDEGWEEEEIDAAIAHIQQVALRQIPGISHYYAFLEKMEKRTAQSSPKAIAMVLGGAFVVLMLLFVGLYILLDPLNIKSTDRDKQRETDIVKVRTAIEAYYTAKNVYPGSLKDLMPTYLQSIPLDPKTGAQYDYKTYNGQRIYELCVIFEIQPSQCINSSPNAATIDQMLIETPTPLQSQADLESTDAPVASATPQITSNPKSSPTPIPAQKGSGDKAL